MIYDFAMERLYMLSDRVVKHIPCNAMQCQAHIAPSGYLAVFPHHFFFLLQSLRFPFFCVFYWEGVKKSGYFTVRLTVSDYPTPPLTVSFLWNFFGVFFILEYDSMCSEMDFTPEKSCSSNYKNSQLLFTAATAALSQNSQIAILQRR